MTREELVNNWLVEGKIIMNEDGTFKLSDDLHKQLTKIINDHPELYSKIFPDRLN